jgi:hypothetical protein
VRALGILAAVALGCVAVAAPAGAKHAAKCRSEHPVVAQNHFVRVYYPNNHDDRPLIACRRQDGVKFVLLRTHYSGFREHELIATDVTLNRHFVGFEELYDNALCETNCRKVTLHSFDTRSGHARLRVANGSTDAQKLVVTVKGALAWTEFRAGDVAVVASDAAGTRTLDSGDIDDRSLGVEQTIVSWTRGGQEYFARLR